MTEVKANLDDIDTLIGDIKTKKDAIDISVSSVKDPSKCKGIMLSDYIKRIRDISSLLNKYKQLLNQDIDDINLSKEKIREMDKQMEDLSKSI